MGGFVFSAPCPSYHPLEYFGELLWIPRQHDRPVEEGIPCLLLQQRRASHLVVYFHANAEDLGHVRSFARILSSQLSASMLAIEYPGYGICSREPSEEAVLSDADLVFQFVSTALQVPAQHVLLMGRSMGGAPAIYLAAKNKVAGLVTISTFSSVRAVVRSFAGWGIWFPNMFDNSWNIRRVSCPALIIHGAEDELVDVAQAEELTGDCGADVSPRAKVTLRIHAGLGHNYFPMEKFVEPISEEFPCIGRGPPLELAAASMWLRRRARWVTQDVEHRVPYDRECIPCGAHLD